MKKQLLQWAALAAALLCLCVPALAEEVFTINVDTLDMDSLQSDAYVAQYLSANTQGVRVSKFLCGADEAAVPVRLTLMQMDSHTLLLDKDYGAQCGVFDSGVIYLPYVGDRTIPYLVTLYVGDRVYAMPFMHLQPRLWDNGACLRGVKLRDLDPTLPGDWMMGRVVDLAALAQTGSLSVDLCASNRYLIGTATIRMQGGCVSVTPHYNEAANVQPARESLYVIRQGAPLSAIYGPAYGMGEWVDVSGADSALLYLDLRLSYDPAGLPTYQYALADDQLALWQRSREAAQNEEWNAAPNSGQWDESGWADDSSWANGWVDNGGWTDGWVDNGSWNDGWVDTPEAEWNAGWDDGWSDGTGWELPVG